jgi:exonuclease III
LQKYAPDLVCIQETKLQQSHVAAHANLLPGFTGYWTCSEEKKGYSGSVCFARGGQEVHTCA